MSTLDATTTMVSLHFTENKPLIDVYVKAMQCELIPAVFIYTTAVYCLLRSASRHRKYCTHLLNYVFWSFLHEIVASGLAAVIVVPVLGYFPVGYLGGFIFDSYIWSGIYLATFHLSSSALCHVFLQRLDHWLSAARASRGLLLACKVHLICLYLASLSTAPIVSLLRSDQLAVKIAMAQTFSDLPAEFWEERFIVNRSSDGQWFLLADTTACLFCFISCIYFPLMLLGSLRKTPLHLSKRTIGIHRAYFRALLLQTSVHFTMMSAPVVVILLSVFQIIDFPRLIYPAMFFMTLHGSASVLAMLVANRPFRKILVADFNATAVCDFTGAVNAASMAGFLGAECTVLVGNVTFDQTIDLSVYRLTELLGNVAEIRGILTVYNTRLESLKFFGKVRSILFDEKEEHWDTLVISENPLLVELGLDSLKKILGSVSIGYNPLLDLSGDCDRLHNASDTLYINLNKVDCMDCVVGELRSLPTDFPVNCTKCSTGISFSYTRFKSSSLMFLETIVDVQGTIYVGHNYFKDLGFLRSMQTITIDYKDRGLSPIVQIQIFENAFLEYLNWTNIKNVSAHDEVHIEIYRNPKLCLMGNEIDALTWAHFDKFESPVCPNDPAICKFETLAKLPPNCTRILGNVSVTSANEDDVQRMKSVERIYGSLTIVANNRSAILVANNLQLSNGVFSSLKRAMSIQLDFSNVEFTNNPRAWNSTMCVGFRGRMFLTSVLVDGVECEAIERRLWDVACGYAYPYFLFFVSFYLCLTLHL